KPGEKPGGLEGIGATAGGKIELPSGSLADLTAIWQQRRIHLRQRDFSLAKVDLLRFVKLKEELALRNTFLEAEVLVRDARHAQQADDAERAGKLLETAVRLAPDLPAVYTARASFHFSKEPFGLSAIIDDWIAAAEAALADPLARNRLLLDGLVGLLLGIGLMAILFTLVQFLRHVRFFLHDLHHLFPRGAGRAQTAFLGVILLLLPVFFRAGLVAVLLTWLLVAWLYQNWRERLVTICILAFLGSMSFSVSYLVDRIAASRTLAEDLYAIERGKPDEALIVRLRSQLERQPNDPTLLAVLAGYHKRLGDFERARVLLEKAVESKPRAAVLLNNLGNVYFLQGHLGKAIESYGRASMARPDLAVPHFNLSRCHYRALDPDRGKQARQEASRLDREEVRKLNELAMGDKANYVVADLPLPSEWLAHADGTGPARERREAAAQALWRSWGGSGRVQWFWIVGAVMLVLFILVAFVGRKLYLSKACIRCGRPACRRCNTELRDDTVCGQCYHAFVRRSQVDAKSRIAKEIQIRQHRRRHQSISVGLSFLLPGTGQILKERTLRGALILLVFSVTMVQLLLGEGVMRDPMAMGSSWPWWKLVPLLVLFGAFYAWALIDVFRSDEE
ncbi:MAG: tetratricopeptide repeat protein, partial [Deltaproteobacteria bacterium]|nr:tetratricopeptide repeat protein [Deltaproteobacteria bacterium]